MAILDIVTYPDPVLKTPAAPVEKVDAELKKLLDNMGETMYAADGVGLAAPQVGILKRIIVLDVSDDRSSLVKLINPVITSRSGEVPSEEGCLSIPEFRETISRSQRVAVEAQTPEGSTIKIEAEGLLAMCLQHEIDHLDGVLFIDRLSRLKREFFKKWLKKRETRE
jgi:peptide deformylase